MEDTTPLLLQARPDLGEDYHKQAAVAFDRFATSQEPIYDNNASTQLDRDFRRAVQVIRRSLNLTELRSAGSRLETKQDIEDDPAFQAFREELSLLIAASAAEWRMRFTGVNRQTARLVVIAFNSEFSANVSPFADRIANAVATRARQLGDRVTLTNFRAILDQVEQGILAGESMDGITQRVNSILDRGLFRTTEDGREFRVLTKPQRARMVARTEAAAMSNHASLMVSQESALNLHKIWITQGDNRVRESHELEEGPFPNGIPLDEAFPVTGMMFPHAVNERCVCSKTGTTPVWTANGFKKIRNIRVGDKVLTHKGTYEKVLAKNKSRGYKGEVVRIHFARGYEAYGGSIVLTPDHPVLTQRGWVSAGHLTDEHSIAVPGNSCPGCNGFSPYYKNFCSHACATESQWEDARTREKMEKGISAAGQKLVEEGQHPLQIRWRENREFAMRQVMQAAKKSADARRGRTSVGDDKKRQQSKEYHRLRREACGRWWKNRRKALERDSYQCRICQIDRHHALLHVHHIISLREGGTNALDNLATLCPSCHAEMEDLSVQQQLKSLGPVKKEGLYEEIQIGFVSTNLVEKRELTQATTRWNLQIESGASYVAGGVVVHNCFLQYVQAPASATDEDEQQ